MLGRRLRMRLQLRPGKGRLHSGWSRGDPAGRVQGPRGNVCRVVGLPPHSRQHVRPEPWDQKRRTQDEALQ